MVQPSPFISDHSTSAEGALAPIFNPATGREIGSISMATIGEVDAAIAAAKLASESWSRVDLQQRINMLFNLRQKLIEHKAEIIDLVIAETGKTLMDASVEVARAVEIIGHATATTVPSATPYTRGVATNINVYEVRYPVGVVAAISPFNFPVMIPLLQTMMAIACGNTVVCKPSERNPSALLRLSEIFAEAGLPAGVFNVIAGDRMAVERIVEHPDVAAITFVGSTPVARHIRVQGVAQGKRVQAFGGGKNHLVVMPDADIDVAAEAAVTAAFGAAGQRCMAVSVVVAVGEIGASLVDAIRKSAEKIVIGEPTDRSTQLGPVITLQSKERIVRHIETAATEGANIVLDGRKIAPVDGGWYVGPTIIDDVRPGMTAHSDEIFGPVLSIVRVASYDEAIATITASDFGNGAAIFTQDASLAARFTDDAQAGQIGINVAIPSPVYFHGFAGWRDSAFTETKMHGRDTIDFLTRTKTVTARAIKQ